MPLNYPGLVTSLSSFFEEPPDTIDGCAGLWADAMQDYSKGMIPQSLAITNNTASAALKQSLIGVFTAWSTQEDAAAYKALMPLLEAAFKAYGALVLAGITTGSEYDGVLPPTGTVGFADLQTADTWSKGAKNVATKINTWMKTGTAKLKVTPFTAITWS